MNQFVGQGRCAQVVDRHAKDRIQVLERNRSGVRGHQVLQYFQRRVGGTAIVDAIEISVQLNRHTAILTPGPNILAMPNFSDLPPADQEAIGKTLLTLLKAFDERDAEPLRHVYSEDADWVNAFGTVKRGRDEIVDYLRGLFRDD